MAPLTWRNVDAPDLSAAANMMARASDGVQKAFKAGGDIGRGIHGNKVEIGSRDAMMEAAKITDSEGWQTAMKNGTAFGNIDPRYINQETIAWGMSREKDLLAMENARAAEARAASAAAGRASGGGGGGGAGRRGGGGGSGGKGASETDKWAVTEAQGALRLAIAEHGEGSPEATAAANALAGVSAATESKGGYLDAVDAVGAGITAEKAEAAAAGDAAAAALADNPYATPYTSVFDIPGQTISGVSEAVAYPASPDSLPVPNATAPGGPLPQEAAALSPVAGLGYSMGTEASVQEAAAVPADFPVSADRPTLSFGQDVPAADVGAVSNDRPVSWEDYAEERLAGTPATAASGSTLDPVELGFNKEVSDRPEWKAFETKVNDFQTYFESRNADLIANRERGHDNLTSPDGIKTVIDSSRSILETTLKENPEFALFDNVPKLKGILAESGIDVVAGEVAKSLNIPSNNSDGLASEIQDFAAENGVDVATAGAAMIAAGGPKGYDKNTFFEDGIAPWNWSPVDAMWSTEYYDPKVAASLIEGTKAVEKDPEKVKGNRNQIGQIRSTLGGLQDQYEKIRVGVRRAEGALEARPNDRALQEAAEKARAQLLETDKNIVEFTRLLPDQLAELGMQGGPGRKATAPEIPQALIDADNQMTANIAEYGTKTPGFVGFRGNEFQTGTVAPDSPFGMRQADQWLPAVISGRATEQEQTSFFDWVAKSPEANAEIFSKLNEMDYLGQNIDLPAKVQEAYKEYASENAPIKAIQDFSSLGFDVAKQPEVAAALANDPEVKSAMERWNSAQSFFTLPGTLKRAEQAAKESIRIALSRDKATEE